MRTRLSNRTFSNRKGLNPGLWNRVFSNGTFSNRRVLIRTVLVRFISIRTISNRDLSAWTLPIQIFRTRTGLGSGFHQQVES